MTYREIGISIRSAYTQGWPDDASRLAFRTETRKLFRDAGWQVEEKEKLHFEATDALQQPLQYAQAMSDGTEETQQTDATQQLQDVQESQEGK